MTIRPYALALTFLAAGALVACGAEETAPAAAPGEPAAAPVVEKVDKPQPKTAVPDSLTNGLVLSLSVFSGEKDADGKPIPLPAQAEFLFRKDGQWQTIGLEDPDGIVFHKLMLYDAGDGPRLLTAAGAAKESTAFLKIWENTASGLEQKVVWQKNFGGESGHSRMREMEIGDIYGDGKASIAVATHNSGVVAVIRPNEGGFDVEEIDASDELPFVHEIELGDLDGDGVLEVYATPSEPNRLDGSPQKGNVVRYIPASGKEGVVVADLGARHAKEILVADLDQNGRDELYVSVEGEIEKSGATQRIKSPVEIRRYEADTPNDQGVVIGVIQDSLCRFLTFGDIEGDGKLELVAAAYSSGLWLFRPGPNPMEMWKMELIDRGSSGFEHAALLTDLDGDGSDELYAASDKHKEVRRYVWNGTRMAKETIYKRTDDRPIFIWNVMPVPMELIPSKGSGAGD
jgi:hypothetical protein